MTMRRSRLAAWLAILAMGLGALWPLLSQARPRSVTLVPICTIGGETHYQELPAGKTPIEQRSTAHCAYCCSTPVVTSHFLETVQVQPAGESAPLAREISFSNPPLSHGRPRAPPSFLLVSSMNYHHDRRDDEKSISLRLRGARAGDGHAGRGDLRLGVLHH